MSESTDTGVMANFMQTLIVEQVYLNQRGSLISQLAYSLHVATYVRESILPHREPTEISDWFWAVRDFTRDDF